VEIENLNKLFHLEVVSKNIWGEYLLRLTNATEQDALELSNYFFESGISIWAQPNFIGKVLLSSIDDPLFGEQWNLLNTGQYGGVPAIDINVVPAWAISTGLPNIIVAIIDDGVEMHEDFSQNQLVLGYTIGGGDGSPHCLRYHGQNVAGIIAANHNNIGVRGIVPSVKIMPINILPQSNDCGGNSPLINQFSVAAAIDTAWVRGADILGSSWQFGNYTCTGYFDPIAEALTRAMTLGRDGKGCLVVNAAGNQCACVVFPGTVSGVLVVGAVTKFNTRALYSAMDTVLPGVVDVVTPSNDDNCLASFFPGEPVDKGITTTARNNSYRVFGYTSAAAPQVAGVAALVLSVNKNLSGAYVRQIIKSYATDFGITDWDGAGLVNAYKTLLCVAPPQNLVSDSVKVNTSPTPFRVSLKWRTHPCATSYKVYRMGWGTYEFVNIATVSQPDTSYIDMDVPWAPSIGEENPIHYYVTALYSSLESDSSNNVSANCAYCLEPPKSHLSIEKEKPTSYALLANYPNPFNPVTQIKYALPEDIHVALKVYDVLGREVAALVNEFQEAGYKEVNFDASPLPSGMYFYRLSAGKFIQVRKMMLMK
jgi:subtilisin family serine protease